MTRRIALAAVAGVAAFILLVVAGSTLCIEIAERLRAEGLPVESLVFEGASHGFDQRDRSAFSPLEFDPAATGRALRRGAQFLDEVGAR